MVLAEAACCGSAPLSPGTGARRGHRCAVPAVGADLRPLLSFELPPAAAPDIASKLAGGPAGRDEAAGVAAGPARADHGGPGRIRLGQAAAGVAEAAQGELAGLPLVPAAEPGWGRAAGAWGDACQLHMVLVES